MDRQAFAAYLDSLFGFTQVNRLESLLLGQIKDRGDQVKGTKILVACSGGGDSMALLHLLVALRASLNLILEVAHIDHRIRPDSGEDRGFVEEEASRLNLSLHARELSCLDGYPGGVEMQAREARWSCLKEIADQQGARWIATGHTLDDHTETVLMRMARGSGLRALTPLSACQSPRWSPLVQLTRSTLRSYLLENKTPWREDPTNALPFTSRNRWRMILKSIREECPSFDEHVWDTHRQSESTLALAEAFVASLRPQSWDLDLSTKSILFKPREWNETELAMIMNLAFREWGYLRESRHLQNLSLWVCRGLRSQLEASNGGYILSLLPDSEGMRLYKE
ncbi:MAG: tRNA lysidine(34) synthetase TilS [Holophagaceae bacterium]